MLADELIHRSLELIKKGPYVYPEVRRRLIRELRDYLREFADIESDPKPAVDEDGEIQPRKLPKEMPVDARVIIPDDRIAPTAMTPRQQQIRLDLARRLHETFDDEHLFLARTVKAFRYSRNLRESIEEFMAFSTPYRFFNQLRHTLLERRINEWYERNGRYVG